MKAFTIVAVLLTFQSFATQAKPVWNEGEAVAKLFQTVAKDFSGRRGTGADRDFIGLEIDFHEGRLFARAGEWTWRAGGDATLWPYECYLSAEEGAVCFHSGGNGRAMLDEKFRVATRARFDLTRAMSGGAPLFRDLNKARRLQAFAAADAIYFALGSRRAWRCDFDGVCASHEPHALPAFPELH